MLPCDGQSEAMQNRIKVANKCISFASIYAWEVTMHTQTRINANSMTVIANNWKHFLHASCNNKIIMIVKGSKEILLQPYPSAASR